MMIAPLPPAEAAQVEILRGPNIKPVPIGKPMAATMSGRVLIKVGDNVTTDHILPAGASILPLRSNIPAISEFTFQRVDPDFVSRAKEWGGGLIVGGSNYGQGSSREHAALSPMYLGVRAVIAKSFARIHYANLINNGILPLTFDAPSDYDTLDLGDELVFADVRIALQKNEPITVDNWTKGLRTRFIRSSASASSPTCWQAVCSTIRVASEPELMGQTSYHVTLIPGDGIGPEVIEASRKVLEATGVRFDWDVQHAGAAVAEREGTPLPEAVLDSIRANGVALKGPVTTPIGSGFRSVNVGIRKALDLYANVRPALTLPGLPGVRSDVDLIVVRENTEGLYVGIEHEVIPDVAAEATRIITRRALEQSGYYTPSSAWLQWMDITAGGGAHIQQIADGRSSQGRPRGGGNVSRHRLPRDDHRRYAHAVSRSARGL